MSTKKNFAIGLKKTIRILVNASNDKLDTESIIWKKPDNTQHLVDEFGLSCDDGWSWTNHHLSWDPVDSWTVGSFKAGDVHMDINAVLNSYTLFLETADWRIESEDGNEYYIKMTSIKAKNHDGMITISFCTDAKDGTHEFLLKLKK